MKLSRIYSKIRCFLEKHHWDYNNQNDRIIFHDETGFYMSVCRFCKSCHKKQERQIIDMGRDMIWIRTDKYTKRELREINLRALEI